MSAEQAMMGGVALLIGVLALTGAIHNRDWYFRLPKTRWIDERWGRPMVRAFYAAAGVALLILGIAIMLGIGRG
jgi:hypothetical protein